MAGEIQETGSVRTRWVAVALLLGVVAGCGQPAVPPAGGGTPVGSPTAAQSGPSSATSPASPSQTPDQTGTTIVAAGSNFGTILFDATGQAIYMFDVETTTSPRCYDACAKAWPPVLTQGVPQAGQGVTASLLGTTPRTGGALQVTYGGHPLYFYAHEGKHEVKCHDVVLNGGTWYALAPDGNRAP